MSNLLKQLTLLLLITTLTIAQEFPLTSDTLSMQNQDLTQEQRYFLRKDHLHIACSELE